MYFILDQTVVNQALPSFMDRVTFEIRRTVPSSLLIHMIRMYTLKGKTKKYGENRNLSTKT